MLVQASRDGDLEVVLRLLYTNPFLQKQELRDALWESARCGRVEVVRSLLEFRVDPSSTPSPTLSQPPVALRHVPWTPLLALAVNGSSRRAELVAELAGAASERRREGGASTPAAAPAAAAEAAPRPCTVDRGGSSCSGSRAPGPPPERRDAGVQCDADSVATEPRGDPLSSRQGFDLLAGLLDSPGAAARQSLLLRLQGEELGAVEAELEASLRLVRRERHERLERQLRSAERRHAEECRGRQNLEEEQMCVVCAEAAKTTLFMPCRHLCTCEACGAQLDACPICRADIRERVKCIQP